MSVSLNIADRLRASAESVPHQRAVVFPDRRDHCRRVSYTHLTFSQLNREADQIARGLMSMGVTPGTRLVLMVRPSLEFIALTFGIFRAGAVCTLIDPGMGRSNIFRCLDEIDPHGFVAIPLVHVIRKLRFFRFGNAKFNVIVGPRRGRLGCLSYQDLVDAGRDSTAELPQTAASDPAAIIFTSGSTGPPKGVLYEHGMFDGQVDLLRERFQIRPGEVDLPGFPLFALFNVAMQVTTVIPDMDPTRPADVDPTKFLEAIEDQGITQSFGSPALWNTFGRYCQSHHIRLPSLRRILSAGAPVPEHVVKRMLQALPPNADIFTPYGATECLPVAAIGGRTVIEETAALTSMGAGTCVGTVFDGMQVRIVETRFESIAHISDVPQLPTGEIGEIIVKGPVATREYFRNAAATDMAKIRDGESFWHRMGDVGYFDDQGRLWFCGRKSHIVYTADGPLYSVCCEAIFNQHARVYRTALVGVGDDRTRMPVIVAEPEAGHFPADENASAQMRRELTDLGSRNPLTSEIVSVLFHRSLPVDTRHNVKINREELAIWAQLQLK